MTRDEALDRLRGEVAAGSPSSGAGAGTGLSAKLAEAGGADLIIIYNSGRYRMGGRGSLAGLLPYGDANAIVLDMAREVLPVVKSTPVLAGVCGTDPFRLMPVFLDELKRIGFSGVQNFPTVGLFDGTLRVGLEETGMGYGLEVDMIRLARERDFLRSHVCRDRHLRQGDRARVGVPGAGIVADRGAGKRRQASGRASGRTATTRQADAQGRKVIKKPQKILRLYCWLEYFRPEPAMPTASASCSAPFVLSGVCVRQKH